MDLLSLNYDSDNVGILTGTSSTSSTSSTTSASSTSSSSSLSTGTLNTGSDEKNVSKGGEMMQRLSDLQTSDPEKFKQVTQSISDKLTAAAKNSTDSGQSGMLSDMAEKFASAAQSGDMSSLAPSEPPSGASGAQGQAAMKYSQTQSSSGANPMAQLDSIISDALSGTESASA